MNKTFEKHGVVDLLHVVQFTIDFGVGVAGNLLASWLYDLLKNRGTKLRINGQSTEIDEEAIKRAVAPSAGPSSEKRP